LALGKKASYKLARQFIAIVRNCRPGFSDNKVDIFTLACNTNYVMSCFYLNWICLFVCVRSIVTHVLL